MSAAQEYNALVRDLEALQSEFEGHAVHARIAGAQDFHRESVAYAWGGAAGRVWRILAKHPTRIQEPLGEHVCTFGMDDYCACPRPDERKCN